MKKVSLSFVSGLLLSTMAFPAMAAKNVPPSAFFDAATCKPPYSTAQATALYDAAEKLGKPNMSSGLGVYRLPAPVSKDGFVAQEVAFASGTVGVLVDGNVADKLAKQYKLAPQKMNILGLEGFSRKLPNAQQGLKELGLIYLVALKSDTFKNKTLLACQFVSNEDQKNLELMQD